MAEDENVTIVSWPKDPASLEHHFDPSTPCPVTISFTETAAQVIVSTNPEKPLDVDMNMEVSAKEPIPVCIKLCEPICAKSDYTIGLNIFDNPFASITVRGITQIGSCREEPPAGERTCVSINNYLKEGMTFAEPFSVADLKISPLGGELRTATFGEPAGKLKLAFPPAGLRIDFPQPVSDVTLTLNNYASPEFQITAYKGADVLSQFTVMIANTVRQVAINYSGITAVTVTGGNNESGLVEVCYFSQIITPRVSAG